MNIIELNQKWNKYCDTTKLVNTMAEWMESKNIRHTADGICDMLDTFFTNKEELIKMFVKSKNYDGDLRIKLNTSMYRHENRVLVNSFVCDFYNKVGANKVLYKTVDDEGKSISDYFKIGKKNVSVADLVNGSMDDVIFSDWNDKFDSDGITKASRGKADKFYNIISQFRPIYGASISNYDANRINNYDETLKIADGTKTSRAFNKVCTKYGIDKAKNYNKLFAEYADMVSGTKRDIKFYISVNPIDYLTMSNGRSWNSCHKVGGGWFGGTVSYMLDSVSIITFVFNETPTDFANEGKIYRNMFHYKDGVLLQSRIYPQGNDGCTNLYDEFRGFVQKEFAEILGKKNEWHTNVNFNSVKRGNHYPDYNSWRNGTNISAIEPNARVNMDIGHINICPYCGVAETLSANYIAHFGCTR